jgi:hypothetical protein
MLYRETVAVYCDIHKEAGNLLCRQNVLFFVCTIWWESGHKGEPNEAPALGRTKLRGAGDVHKMRVFYPKHYPMPKINIVLLLLFIVIYAFTSVPK